MVNEAPLRITLQLPLRVFCDTDLEGNDVQLIVVDHIPNVKQWRELCALSNDKDSQGQPKTICVVVVDGVPNTRDLSPPLLRPSQNTQQTATKSSISTRWFQGNREIQLCGSALVATAYALEHHLGITLPQPLSHNNRQFELWRTELPQDFSRELSSPIRQVYGFSMPRTKLQSAELPVDAVNWLNTPITHAVSAGNETGYWIVEVSEPLTSLTPNFNAICASTKRAIIVTTQKPSGSIDYSLRYFAPQYGIDEDIATGSANAIAACYWSEKLKKNQLTAEQLPANHSGGRFYLTLDDCAVKVFGEVCEYQSHRNS